MSSLYRAHTHTCAKIKTCKIPVDRIERQNVDSLTYFHSGERYLYVGIDVFEIAFAAQAAHVRQSVGTINDKDVSSALPERQTLAADG